MRVRTSSLEFYLPRYMVKLVKSGYKAKAIRHVREMFAVSKKTASQVVDQAERQLIKNRGVIK